MNATTQANLQNNTNLIVEEVTVNQDENALQLSDLAYVGGGDQAVIL
jgi:hypothetical protein